MATYSVSTKFTAIDNMSAVMKKINSNVAGFEKSLNKVENAFGASIGKLGQFGLALGAGAIAMVAGKSIIDLDNNMKSLSAITGITGSAFDVFKTKINELSQETNMFKGDIAKAMEVVGNAAPEYLKNASALKEVTKASIILGKASGDDLANSAMALTGVMNQFNLSANQASRVMNVLAAGSQVGSASVILVNEAMTNFGAVASTANMTVEESVALIEVLGKKSIYGAEAGNKLRSSVVKLQQSGLGYQSGIFNINDALSESKKEYDKLSSAKEKDAYLMKVFGLENITAGTIILDNIQLFKEYTKGVTNTTTAIEQANIKSSSLGAMISRLSDKFKNFLTSTDDNNLSLTIMRGSLSFITDNLGKLIITIGVFLGLYALIKLALIGWKIYTYALVATQWLHNSSIIFNTKCLLSNKLAMILTATATGILTAVTWVATAATWAFGAALAFANAMNPVAWIIAAIAAIALMIIYWDKVKKKIDEWSNSAIFQILKIINPILLIVEMISFMQDRWNGIKKAFTEGGFVSGIVAIGKAIISFILKPFEVIIGAIGRLTGFQWAKDLSASIGNMRTSLDAELITKDVNKIQPAKSWSESPMNPEAQIQKNITESKTTNYVQIGVSAEKGSTAKIESNKGAIPIFVTPNLK